MRRRGALVLALAAALGAGGAAAERLTAEGAALAPVALAPGAPLERRVETGGETVVSVHVTLRPASSNRLLARDRDGFWAPWSGDLDALPPSAAVREGDTLVFKLFETPPEGLGWPLTVTLFVRTESGLKLGWFQAAPAGAAP